MFVYVNDVRLSVKKSEDVLGDEPRAELVFIVFNKGNLDVRIFDTGELGSSVHSGTSTHVLVTSSSDFVPSAGIPQQMMADLRSPDAFIGFLVRAWDEDHSSDTNRRRHKEFLQSTLTTEIQIAIDDGVAPEMIDIVSIANRSPVLDPAFVDDDDLIGNGGKIYTLQHLREIPENTFSYTLTGDGAEYVVSGEVIVKPWSSVLLFCNLDDSGDTINYLTTVPSDASDLLDEGTDALTPGIKEYVQNYWSLVTYGILEPGIATPRNNDGPIIYELETPEDGPDEWPTFINECLDADADNIWRTAGGLLDGATRLIPSLVLVQNYDVKATAGFSGFDRTVDGNLYRIGDTTHVRYSMARVADTTVAARAVWGVLCHEFGHNFAEFWDLYGPQGSTGYWDLLGDFSIPGTASEISSVHKERVGWLSYKQEILGPQFSIQNFELASYSTTGEAIKIVPDPEFTPWEYFVLEFRGPTGSEIWRPDGGLPGHGLFITHINDRFNGVTPTWLLRDAPYWDPEFADFSHKGGTDWSDSSDLDNKLYPIESNNSFTVRSQPDSNFYGNRPSGLSIVNITRIGDVVKFDVAINGNPTIGWKIEPTDRTMVGSFTPEAVVGGQELILRKDDSLGLAIHREATWVISETQDQRIGEWVLGPKDRELAADLDGDGLDEVYITSENQAGVLKHDGTSLVTTAIHTGTIDSWNLDSDDREYVIDVDGDGIDEIFVRSENQAGVIRYNGSRLILVTTHTDRIDTWELGPKDQHFVGTFTSGLQQILIRSRNNIGLLGWDRSSAQLLTLWQQADSIGDWTLGDNDLHVIGDFDGDGIDEIYVRTETKAYILKWETDSFKVLWSAEDLIIGNDAIADVELKPDDKIYSGRFTVGKDAILHRTDSDLIVLALDDMIDLRPIKSLNGVLDTEWTAPETNYTIGDFHRVGPDVVDVTEDYVIDGMSDIVLLKGERMGMLGVTVQNSDEVFGYSWDQKEYLMMEK